MNKFFSAALYCGLLLSGGKALAVGTDLLKRLDDEKIIGQEKTNPFIASETATTPQKAAVDLPQSQASKPADPVPRASAVKSDKAAGIDPAKITRLNDALRQANSTITALNKQLSVLEREKASLEQAVAHEKDRVAEKEQALARLKPQPDGSAQKLAVESLIAALPTSADIEKQKNAELAEQLRKANAQHAALTKQLADLQAQKNALDTQLASLKTHSEKSTVLTGEIDALKAQLSTQNQQKTALEKRLAELEKEFNSEKAKSAIAQSQLEDTKKVLASQESLLATQKSSAGSEKEKLTKELTDLQAQKKALETELIALKETREKNAVLTKQLAELQAQRQVLDAQLATLKASGDKSTGVVKELDTLKAQLSALNLQKATLETRLAEQEKQFSSEKTKSDIVLKQLEDAKKVIASQESLLSLHKSNTGIEKEKSSAQLATTGKETAELKKQLAELQRQNASLEEKYKTQNSSLTALTAENQKLKETQAKAGKDVAPVQQVKIDKTASKDTKTSYAIGAWYGDAAEREKAKLDGLNKKLDLNAFMQGFNDKVTNKLQLAEATLSKELTALDQLQKKQFVATQSENEKQSKAIMTKAANEKGAKRLPDGAVYRVIKKGEAPLINDKNEIMTEIDEVLGTGKVMSRNEIRASRVKDLPPLFQTVVKKLGLGGEAKIHIPAKQAYGESGVPGFVPPGTVSIITIKIIGIK